MICITNHLLNEFVKAKDIKYNFLWPEIFIAPFKIIS